MDPEQRDREKALALACSAIRARDDAKPRIGGRSHRVGSEPSEKPEYPEADDRRLHVQIRSPAFVFRVPQAVYRNFTLSRCSDRFWFGPMADGQLSVTIGRKAAIGFPIRLCQFDDLPAISKQSRAVGGAAAAEVAICALDHKVTLEFSDGIDDAYGGSVTNCL